MDVQSNVLTCFEQSAASSVAKVAHLYFFETEVPFGITGQPTLARGAHAPSTAYWSQICPHCHRLPSSLKEVMPAHVSLVLGCNLCLNLRDELKDDVTEPLKVKPGSRMSHVRPNIASENTVGMLPCQGTLVLRDVYRRCLRAAETAANKQNTQAVRPNITTSHTGVRGREKRKKERWQPGRRGGHVVCGSTM
eukprot:1798626-Rhodomonas_salina.4